MINGALVHPQVIAALAGAGHTAKILVADGHFPANFALPADVPVVYLNYAPDSLSLVDVLGPLVDTIPIETATAATFEDGSKPEVWADYARLLPGLEIQPVKGSELGAVVNTPSLALAIITGEMRAASCIVLAMGIRKAE